MTYTFVGSSEHFQESQPTITRECRELSGGVRLGSGADSMGTGGHMPPFCLAAKLC